MWGIIRFVLRILGLVEKVQAHTRLRGLVKVAAYWRRA
jgi:hypothetical protein